MKGDFLFFFGRRAAGTLHADNGDLSGRACGISEGEGHVSGFHNPEPGAVRALYYQ